MVGKRIRVWQKKNIILAPLPSSINGKSAELYSQKDVDRDESLSNLQRAAALLNLQMRMRKNAKEVINWSLIEEDWSAALVRVEKRNVGHSFVLLRNSGFTYLIQSYVNCLSIRWWLRNKFLDTKRVDRVLFLLSNNEPFKSEDFGVEPVL